MLKGLIRKLKIRIWGNEKYARSLGVKIGKNCNIQIINFGSEPYLVSIGNHVQITTGTKIFTHGGGWVYRDKYPNLDFFGKVEIKDNVYIGNNCLIMPGVTIHSNVIVAAGTVVTKSIPEGSIVGGNPGRIIGTIYEFEKKIIEYNLNTKGLNYNEKKALLESTSEEKFIKK